jgi:hypothetical protein
MKRIAWLARRKQTANVEQRATDHEQSKQQVEKRWATSLKSVLWCVLLVVGGTGLTTTVKVSKQEEPGEVEKGTRVDFRGPADWIEVSDAHEG